MHWLMSSIQVCYLFVFSKFVKCDFDMRLTISLYCFYYSNTFLCIKLATPITNYYNILWCKVWFFLQKSQKKEKTRDF